MFGFTLDEQARVYHVARKVTDSDGKDMKRIYSGNNGNVNLWAPELRKDVKQGKSTGEKATRVSSTSALIDISIGRCYTEICRTLQMKATEGKARLLYEVAPLR